MESARPLAEKGNWAVIGFDAGERGFARQMTGADDFRFGEAHRGNGGGIEAALMAGNDFGNHFALGGGLVFQHGLADQIADGEDALHGGAALVVHLDEAASHVEAIFSMPQPSVCGLAADGDENLVRTAIFSVLPSLVSMTSALFSRALRLGAKMDGDAILLKPARDGLGEIGIVERQDAVQRFHHGDLGAQLGERDAEFEADIAGADHRELLRHRIESEALRWKRSHRRRISGTAVRPAPSRWRAAHARP